MPISSQIPVRDIYDLVERKSARHVTVNRTRFVSTWIHDPVSTHRVGVLALHESRAALADDLVLRVAREGEEALAGMRDQEVRHHLVTGHDHAWRIRVLRVSSGYGVGYA